MAEDAKPGKDASATAKAVAMLLINFAVKHPQKIHRILTSAAEAGFCPKKDVPDSVKLSDGNVMLDFILKHPDALQTIFADAEFIAFFQDFIRKNPFPSSRAPSGGSSSPIR